jgi:nicotinate-nucleotide adenylyltransferase
VITVGLFGGSFNPPHVAHALVGLYALETQGLDELWLVPTWRHAFGKQLASYDDRVAMCERVAAALGPRARVSRVEEIVARARGGESRTLHTLEHLASAEPARQFRLVIGADILAETASWLGWDEVCRRAPPIVIGRGGVAAPAGRVRHRGDDAGDLVDRGAAAAGCGRSGGGPVAGLGFSLYRGPRSVP